MTLTELIDKIDRKYDSWDFDTKEIFDEMWNRMEMSETDLEVLEARIKKQWTDGSNLYTQKEMDNKIEEMTHKEQIPPDLQK